MRFYIASKEMDISAENHYSQNHYPHNHWAGKSTSFRKLFLALILVLGILPATAGIAGEQVLVFSTILGKVKPVAEAVMTEAYNRLGITMKIKLLPPKRALQDANNGLVDGALFRNKNIGKRYPNLVIVPVPIVSIDEMVFTKKGREFPVDGWESLLPYTVGHRLGIKVIEDHLVEGTISEAVPRLEQLFKKLAVGRNDVVIETRVSGLATINALGLKDIVMLEPPLISIHLYHCLHVRNAYLLEPLTNVLKEMEKQGLIREIQRKVQQANLIFKKGPNSYLWVSAEKHTG